MNSVSTFYRRLFKIIHIHGKIVDSIKLSVDSIVP